VYLYVATRNISFNYCDRQKRTATNSLDDVSVEFTSRYFDPEQLLITADMMSRLGKEIDKLPPKCKMIFKLIKEDNLRYREVAEILNISVKTVENQLTIALRKIGHAVRFDIGKTISSPFSHSK
jgi:RNA polymerase sigma factor (sigma-70 family)